MNRMTTGGIGFGTIEPPGSGGSGPWRGAPGREQVIKRGLWVLLAALTSLFLLFIGAYLMRMRHGDWQPLPEPDLLWLNTVVLALSSLVLQLAVVALRHQRHGAAVIAQHLAGALALTFLLGQLWVWRQLSGTGYFAVDNPATAFFYLITGVHALHLLGGLIAWGRGSFHLFFGDSRRAQLSVELCALYWHFLLLVWLLVFGVFLVT